MARRLRSGTVGHNAFRSDFGITLLALYGAKSPFGVNLAYTQAGILVALLFVTLPFVVRTVQPGLLELDQQMIALGTLVLSSGGLIQGIAGKDEAFVLTLAFLWFFIF